MAKSEALGWAARMNSGSDGSSEF